MIGAGYCMQARQPPTVGIPISCSSRGVVGRCGAGLLSVAYTIVGCGAASTRQRTLLNGCTRWHFMSCKIVLLAVSCNYTGVQAVIQLYT